MTASQWCTLQQQLHGTALRNATAHNANQPCSGGHHQPYLDFVAALLLLPAVIVCK